MGVTLVPIHVPEHLEEEQTPLWIHMEWWKRLSHTWEIFNTSSEISTHLFFSTFFLGGCEIK